MSAWNLLMVEYPHGFEIFFPLLAGSENTRYPTAPTLPEEYSARSRGRLQL